MKLTLNQNHLSLVSLPDTDLPKFTVITGKNGAGKSHLLQAMDLGHVRIDIAPQFQGQIRLFDWNNLVPNKARNFESQTLIKENQTLFRNFDSQRRSHQNQIITAARQAGIPHEYLSDVSKLSSLSETEACNILGDESKGKAAFVALSAAIKLATNGVVQRMGSNSPNARAVLTVGRHANKSIFALDRDEFVENLPARWGQANLFQQSFSRLFVAYRDLELENRLRRCAHEDGESETPPLSPEEFRRRHNIPPWEFVNRVLKDAQLPFKIDAPARYRRESYSPTLIKTTTNVPVDFDALSSGEKVLMSFALCVYYARDRRQLSVFPKVLLLDEVDAPLHPSMCRSLVNTITDTLVKSHGIHVVLATHSPSTVAMVPESSVHVMHADEPGIHKVSKGKALNLLTDGVPTLAIGFDGRRQVFVESKHDSSVYDCLYQNLKADLESERSLSFIPAGTDKDHGEDGGGCEPVKRVVGTLADTGNLTVMGLIDWDKKNSSTDRIHVLAEGERYSLENSIYDPIVISASIARDASTRWEDFGIPDTNYMSFQSLQKPELQRLVELVESRIVGSEESTRVTVGYFGGLELEVTTAYLEMNGHKLEAAIQRLYRN